MDNFIISGKAGEKMKVEITKKTIPGERTMWSVWGRDEVSDNMVVGISGESEEEAIENFRKEVNWKRGIVEERYKKEIEI